MKAPLILIAVIASSVFFHWSELSPRFKSIVGLNSSALIPVRQNFVTSDAGLLSDEETEALNRTAREIFEKSGVTIYVLLVKTSRGIPIESFALKVFDQWQPGTAAEDRGLLLVIATEERQARLEVGYGLEGDITDLFSHRILEAESENFKAGQWPKAIQNILIRTAAGLNLETTASAMPARRPGPRLSEFERASWWQKLIGLTFMAGIFAIIFLRFAPFFMFLLIGWPSFVVTSIAFPFLMGFYAGHFNGEIVLLAVYLFMSLLNIYFEKRGWTKISGGNRYGGASWASGFWSRSGGSFGGRSGGGGATFRW